MIEVFNTERTESFGRFVNFKAAKITLSNLIDSGELPGKNSAVLVCAYKNNVMQREYVATYNGKWHVPRLPEEPIASNEHKCNVRKAKQSRCNKYKSAEKYFREGLPDWINRVYQSVN